MIKRCRVCNGRIKYDKENNKYVCSNCGQEYLDNTPKTVSKPKTIKKEKNKDKSNEAKKVQQEQIVKVETNKNKKNYKHLIKTILTWTVTIVLCLGAAKLFTTYVVSSVEVDGYSMYPNLDDGDKAFTDALFFKMRGIKRFDIVIINKKSGDLKGTKLVKRIIGLPGEKIKYENSTLYINDHIIEEDFIKDEIKEKTGSIVEFTLGSNEYFVMGDNREFSSDSRYFGPIKKNEIIGRGFLRFMKCYKKDSSHNCIGRKPTWFENVR